MAEQQADPSGSTIAGTDNFETWANLYVRHGAFNHPSELHGALTGQLATGQRLTEARWDTLAAEHLGTESFLPAEAGHPDARSFLASVYDEVLAGLQSEQMNFQLLLPEDEAPMGERLFALSAWVRGFLEGMARAGGERLAGAPEEVRELIEDFVAISQVEDDIDEEEEEDNEAQWVEVSEFVRVGAMTVFAEFNREPNQKIDRESPPPTRSLH